MFPFVIIGIAALIGFSRGGLSGIIIGAITGYLVTLIAGSISMFISGGLLPRKVRRQTASSFIQLQKNIIQQAFPDKSGKELQRLIEQSIEGIFKRSIKDDKSITKEVSWSLTAIQAAAAALIAEESRPKQKDYLASLLRHIEQTMYP